MIKLAANLSFLYQDLPFLDRFSAAAQDGFKGVEFLFPYEWPAKAITERLQDHDLQQVLFNLSPGDWATGDRGMASHPQRQGEFLETVRQALDYADALNCASLHVMSGNKIGDLPVASQKKAFIEALHKALDLAQEHKVTLLIEPLNPDDMPGYFLNDFNQANEIIAEINNPSLRLQFDIYHCQKIHGNLIRNLEKYCPMTHHIQIANPPHRSEPTDGEINFPYLLEHLKGSDYSGWIGCEYKPSAKTGNCLEWAQNYLTKI